MSLWTKAKKKKLELQGATGTRQGITQDGAPTHSRALSHTTHSQMHGTSGCRMDGWMVNYSEMYTACFMGEIFKAHDSDMELINN